MASVKPATVYFDTHIHRVLKVRAAKTGTTVSALVNEAVRRLLAEAGEESGGGAQDRLKLDWAGALKDLRDDFSSVELQHRARDWREP